MAVYESSGSIKKFQKMFSISMVEFQSGSVLEQQHYRVPSKCSLTFKTNPGFLQKTTEQCLVFTRNYDEYYDDIYRKMQGD